MLCCVVLCLVPESAVGVINCIEQHVTARSVKVALRDSCAQCIVGADSAVVQLCFCYKLSLCFLTHQAMKAAGTWRDSSTHSLPLHQMDVSG